MYIRLLYFKAKANQKNDLLSIMDDIMPKIKKQPGCKDCKFIMHDGEGRYALLVFWETKEQADASALIIGPQLLPALDKIANETVAPLLFEVYEPESVLS